MGVGEGQIAEGGNSKLVFFFLSLRLMVMEAKERKDNGGVHSRGTKLIFTKEPGPE